VNTALPDGAIVRWKERGQWAHFQIVGPDEDEPESCYTGVCRPLVKGDVVHDCVWKGDRLEVRKSYTLVEDADWVPLYPPSNMTDTANPQSIVPGLQVYEVWLSDHRVILSPGNTSVSGGMGGFSWSWIDPQCGPDGFYHGIGITGTETPAEILAFAKKALDEYHKDGGNMIPCPVCHPPHHNVEKPRKRGKK
jgi:hypothetical protein